MSMSSGVWVGPHVFSVVVKVLLSSNCDFGVISDGERY